MKRKMAITLMVLAILIGSISGVASATNSENPTSSLQPRLLGAPIDEAIAGNVIIQANAEDDRGIATVDYSIDYGDSILMTMVSGNNLSGVWEAEWDTTAVEDGAHTITVIATDSGNQPSEPYQIEATVDNTDDPPQVTSVIILTPTPTPTPTSTLTPTPTSSPTTTPTATPPPTQEWVYEVTYPSQTTTYWKSTMVLEEDVDDIPMDDLLTAGGSLNDWNPANVEPGICNRIYTQAYTDAACTSPTNCIRKNILSITVIFPQYDWRGVDDHQLRTRLATAKVSSTTFNNILYYRTYTNIVGTWGAPYATGEQWSFVKQTDSGYFMGDSTVTVTATVSTEAITVPAGTFNCYKITFDNGDAEWWDADGVFLYAPIQYLSTTDFDDDQLSSLYSSTVIP